MSVKFASSEAVKNPTPKWATWGFRIFFYLGNFIIFILSVDNTIPAETALAIIKWNSIAVVGVHMVSRLIGVDSQTMEQDAREAINQAQAQKQK